MKNKDMRRVARKFWRENWFTIFLSYIAGLLGFVLLTMLFSSLLNPLILFTGDFSLGELRRGIGLSLTGILFALYVFVCIFYFIVLGFSFRKMLLEMSRGEKKVNAAMIFYGFHPNSFPLLGRMLGFSILAFLFSTVISLGQEVIDYFLGEGLIYWSYYGVSFAVLIFFSLFFDMTFFTVWDGEGNSLWQNMKKSVAVMKGQKFSYFRQILYFSLVTSVAGFIAVMWSFILKSPALPIFVLFLYLSIYLLPYMGFVQALIYRKGAGDFSTISATNRDAYQRHEEPAVSEQQPSTVEAALTEQSATVEGAPTEQSSTVEGASAEQSAIVEGASTKQPNENEGGFSVVISEDQEERNLIGASETAGEGMEAGGVEQDTAAAGTEATEAKQETAIENKPESDGENKPESDGENKPESDEENKPESDEESKQDPNHKMSFEEARRQYTDYEE
ncbi:hypothetical protein [Oribacterium sinus]|uniref:Glycerophosphoryl diester phosphodiesterase membrane domain-containing protein n=1 Tax=Oribacterium sinus F0268 TaxID=585501 RepID=C2L176_9FIRM|nr:hypothetical protein [Oribacterium sinus]EEJ50226.1 hypothetical protein HMPREF6123_2495 [Oribacterium sinus F0268]